MQADSGSDSDSESRYKNEEIIPVNRLTPTVVSTSRYSRKLPAIFVIFQCHLNFLHRFSESSQIWKCKKIPPVEPRCSKRTDGRADMTKLIISLRNFATTLKNGWATLLQFTTFNWVRPASWSSGQSFWLQITRSRFRFPALQWGFSLWGEDPRGDHGLGS